MSSTAPIYMLAAHTSFHTLTSGKWPWRYLIVNELFPTPPLPTTHSVSRPFEIASNCRLLSSLAQAESKLNALPGLGLCIVLQQLYYTKVHTHLVCSPTPRKSGGGAKNTGYSGNFIVSVYQLCAETEQVLTFDKLATVAVCQDLNLV